MLRIQFRGKTKKDGKWLYGYIGQSRTRMLKNEYIETVIFSNTLSFNNDNYSFIVNDISIQEDTIGQYSGLNDKNKTKIYEGDIIKWHHDDRLYVVVFKNGMFYASVEECNNDVFGGFPLYALCDEEKGYNCEIIGNIYDNPELIKNKY